jgi:hypothetical protein
MGGDNIMTVVLEEPVKIFDGFVENASMSIGYGSDSGTCQLSVIFEGDGPKRTSDKEKNIPTVGTAAAFKFGECVFGGILQRYTHRKSLDGYRWDIIIESPGKWLDGIQVILDGFQGSSYNQSGAGAFTFTNQANNIWNPFAVRENYDFGGRFGFSNTNSAGFPAWDALRIIEEISRGEHAFGGPAKFGESSYEIDLSEVIRITPSYFRLKGPVQSLASIIQECCDIALHDYVVFIDSKEEIQESGIIEKPIIRIKVIDKSFFADSNYIKSVVEDYEKQGILVSADHGKEFPDIVTQRLVIGGPASRISLTPAASSFPIWGKTRSGYLTGNGLEMNSVVNLAIKATGAIYTTDVLEVRCAMSGFNTWILYHLLKNNSFPCFTNIGLNDYQFQGLIRGTLTINQILDNTAATADYTSQMYTGQNFMEFLSKIYDEIREAGEEFYGRKFLVPLPQEPGGISNNVKFLSEDLQYVSSWQISDSAWSGGRPFSDFNFYDDEGRLKSYAVWSMDARLDYSSLGSDWDLAGGVIRGIGTHKISVEREISWYNGTPHAVVEVPPVAGYDDVTTQQYGLFHLCKALRGVQPSLSVMSSFGAENGPLSYQICPRRIGPRSFGVAQESSRYNWGPWWWVSDYRGKAEVLVEETLKPETFGSAAAAELVGFSYANTAGATLNGVETGYIELAEIPKYNIASKFSVSGPYITGIDINISSDGIKTTYKFNTWTPEFGKLARYNAERLSRINKNQIRFFQDRRSRWSKPPFPSKGGKDSVQSSTNMISPIWGMNAVNGVFSNLLSNGSVNMVSGNITNSLAPINENKGKAYGASLEQIYSPQKVAKANTKFATATSPIPGYSDLNPYFPTPDGTKTAALVPALYAQKDKAKTDFQLSVFDTSTGYDLQDPKNDKVAEVSTTASFRVPMLLSGWGFALDGAPVPYDPQDPRKFHKNALNSRSLWKNGPLQLMWDEELEVWAGGLHILEGLVLDPIVAPANPSNPTAFRVSIYRKSPSTNWSNHGEVVTCYNRDPSLAIAQPGSSTYAQIIRINYEWRPLYIGCA